MNRSPLPLPPAAATASGTAKHPLRLDRAAAASDSSEAAGDDCGDATRAGPAGDGGARLLAAAWI